MCLWKDQYTLDELLGSTLTLTLQLKQFRRQCRFAKSDAIAEYVQWLVRSLSFNRLNRFADRLLDAAGHCVSIRPVVAQIVLQLELKYVLPERRLQMEYLTITEATMSVSKMHLTDTYDGYSVKLEKAHI